MNRLLFVVAALSVLALGCKPATDLNNRCVLVKRNPADGGTPVNLRESEVRSAQAQNKDFIAVGSLDCDDLICVRDSFFETDSGLDAPAEGYCSRECGVIGSLCPSFSEALDKGPKALNCRTLLLSPETLAELKGDGAFPGIRDSKFCARTGGPDAGM